MLGTRQIMGDKTMTAPLNLHAITRCGAWWNGRIGEWWNGRKKGRGAGKGGGEANGTGKGGRMAGRGGAGVEAKREGDGKKVGRGGAWAEAKGEGDAKKRRGWLGTEAEGEGNVKNAWTTQYVIHSCLGKYGYSIQRGRNHVIAMGSRTMERVSWATEQPLLAGLRAATDFLKTILDPNECH